MARPPTSAREAPFGSTAGPASSSPSDAGAVDEVSERPPAPPVVGRRGEADLPLRVRSIATTGLFILACLYTLYFAADILMPIAVALILFLILWPLVRFLARLRIPEPLAAGLVVLGLLGAVVIGIFFLAEPATRWITEVPEMITEVQSKIKGPVEEIQAAKEKVERAMGVEEGRGAGVEPATVPIPEDARPEQAVAEIEREAEQGVKIGLLDIVSTVAKSIGNAGWTLTIIFVLLFFFLATGEIYQEKIVKVLPTLSDKKRAISIIRRVHRDVATYLLTVTLINCGLGVAIGTGLYLVGLPNAVLWGVMATLLNFIPYLGAFTGEVIVGVVGLTVYQDPIDALKPVGVYLAANVIEAQLVTPAILGRRLTMNPVIVFLAVLFWGWLWGIAGALIAVPMLACFKVICGAFERLRPLSEFLGR